MKRITFTADDRDAYLKFQQSIHDIACLAQERMTSDARVQIQTSFSAISTEHLAEFLGVSCEELVGAGNRTGAIFQTTVAYYNRELSIGFDICSADAYPTATELAASICKACDILKSATWRQTIFVTLFDANNDAQWVERVRGSKSIRHALIEVFDTLVGKLTNE